MIDIERPAYANCNLELLIITKWPVKDIRRKTRKRYSSEEKIRIILAGLRGEDSIADPQVAKRYYVNANLIFKWVRDPRYCPWPASQKVIDLGPISSPVYWRILELVFGLMRPAFPVLISLRTPLA